MTQKQATEETLRSELKQTLHKLFMQQRSMFSTLAEEEQALQHVFEAVDSMKPAALASAAREVYDTYASAHSKLIQETKPL